ncbi:hypothetical protein KBB12_02470 [Candidatus Woesebacteria bacterium]|nr:hypothetical protein [Candidatus Woesebacteria bacterium]
MIHKRRKKFFSLFSKPSRNNREVSKFSSKKLNLRKPHHFPTIKFNFNALTGLFKRTEVTLTLSIALIAFFIFIFVHYFFMISKIGIKDMSGYQISDWHMEGLEKIKGRNILFMSPDIIERIVRDSNPSIGSMQVNILYPQTIELLVRLQEPVAYFTYDSTRFFLLSKEGTLLKYEYERPKNLGEILYYQAVTPGEYALGKPMGSRDIRFAAEIAGILNKYGFDTFVITVNDSHLILGEVGNLTIRAASDSDLTRQLSSLDQVVRISQKGGETIKSVDVRFDKIIIEK